MLAEGAAGNKKQWKTIKVKTKAIADYLGYESDFGIDFNGDGLLGRISQALQMLMVM